MIGRKYIIWNKDEKGVEEMLKDLYRLPFKALTYDVMNWTLTKKYKSLTGDKMIREFGTVYLNENIDNQAVKLYEHLKESIKGFYDIDLTFIYIPKGEM